MARTPRFTARNLLILVLLSTFTLWSITHILRPTLAGRLILSYSPTYHGFPSDAFDFSKPRPEWLIPPRLRKPATAEPPALVLRIAVISHPEEVERRAAIRAHVFQDVPLHEVTFEYKFFVGRVPGERLHSWSKNMLDEVVDGEQKEHGDMFIIEQLKESSSGLGIKRHAALHWVGINPQSSIPLLVLTSY
jgi:hypothetical protein